MLKKIKAYEVQVGDLIEVRDATYEVIKTEKGYNTQNIHNQEDYGDDKDHTGVLEDYVKSWLYNWNGEVEFYRVEEDIKEYTFTEILKLAETKNFEAISKENGHIRMKFEDGLMYSRVGKGDWKEATVSIYWNKGTYKVDESTITEIE